MACLPEAAKDSKLLVFDLDLTLWPFRLDKHMRSPFQRTGGKVIDSCGREATLNEDTLITLEFIKERGHQIGIASRIEDLSGAYQLINLLNIAPYISYREIYPGCKKKHFNSIHQKSKFNFTSMLFFDDDRRNIRDVSTLGVVCFHNPDGISKNVVKKALELN